MTPNPNSAANFAAVLVGIIDAFRRAALTSTHSKKVRNGGAILSLGR